MANSIYFNINYEFDRQEVHRRIGEAVAEGRVEYVCVADGVILNLVNRRPDYREVVGGAMFSICDSSYVPLYLRWLYGLRLTNYCGSDIFRDMVAQKRYRMFFLGTDQATLDALKDRLMMTDERIAGMTFMELPYRDVADFDYEDIARQVDADGADIVWVALGAPKQEIFMSRLKPYLHRGVMIAVGAVFKFYSGRGEKRAPQWMLDHHLEFVYRILRSPRKQLNRCAWIIRTLPGLLYREWKRKNAAQTDKKG
jgi:N-acetylglucosaminyldiphosphoundecaprenol N-acetyl-beta-D-mannosaminyltransferase